MEKVGYARFNEETNFLKHADSDPEGDLDDNFQTFTEAGIGMAIGLYKGKDKNLSPEMMAFLVWSAYMRPGFYELSPEANQTLEEWRKASSLIRPRSRPTKRSAISVTHSYTGLS
jgi:hypothetical protein